MRRSASPLSLVLLGFGVFLIVLAPMLAWYVEPHAKRTPTDIDATTIFTGTGSYFDADSVATKKNQKLTITRRVLGDVAASEKSGRAIWDVSTTVDTPKTLPLKDARRSFQWTTERWVTDRRTNEPVHCCKEKPVYSGEAYLKFPFDVEKRSYRWWDNTLGATVRLHFDGTTRIQGHRGYRFTGTVKATKTGTRQVPGLLVKRPKQGQILAEEWYANSGIELVADRRTGRIIYAKTSPKMTLRAPGAKKDAVVLLESSGGLAFNQATQRDQVSLASDDGDRLKLVGTTAPVAGGALGLLLAAGGVVLLVRGRSRPTSLQPSTM